MSLRRVLIANRGEIAVRIARACAAEKVECVAAVSAADRGSVASGLADSWVCVGPAPSAQSYLSIPSIIAAAIATGCDAIHPGYGFLSEQPDLVEACSTFGLTFIGPRADTIRRAGTRSRPAPWPATSASRSAVTAAH